MLASVGGFARLFLYVTFIRHDHVSRTKMSITLIFHKLSPFIELYFALSSQLCNLNTVELQWLEHILDHEN